MTHDDEAVDPEELPEADLDLLDRRAMGAATGLRSAVAATSPRPIPLHARRVAPVLAAAALLVVAAVAVLLVRDRQPTTVASGPTAPLYLVPSHLPDGFHLTGAVDTTGGDSSSSSILSDGTPTTDSTVAPPAGAHRFLTSLHFIYGDPTAADPLAEPAVAVWVTPDLHDLSRADTFSAAYDITPPRQVTRNGRTISVRSLRTRGADAQPMYGAAVVLPEAGAVTIWGTTLTESQVVQLAASIHDAHFQLPERNGDGVPDPDPAWETSVIAVLQPGSKLLWKQLEVAAFPVESAARLGSERNESALTYDGSRRQEPPQSITIDIRPGGDGLLAADRFFLRSESVTIAGRHGWVVRWPVAGSPPASDGGSMLPTVEWVQDGHVVRVIGDAVTIDQVTMVAESLHEVSTDEWRDLLAPLRRHGAVIH